MNKRTLLNGSHTIKSINTILGNLRDVETMKERLLDDLSFLDTRRSDIYHLLEDMHQKGKGLNPIKHFFILKQLQKLSIDRRKAKTELDILNYFIGNRSMTTNKMGVISLQSRIDTMLNEEYVYKTKTFTEVDEMKEEYQLQMVNY